MRKRILIVDDDPQITRVMSIILRGTDACEVESCNDPLEAYARVVTNRYDLLILDIQMPLAGDQLSAAIEKAIETGIVGYKPKLMLMSGALSHEELFNLRCEVEAATFLKKPFHPGTLQSIVSTVLEIGKTLTTRPAYLAA